MAGPFGSMTYSHAGDTGDLLAALNYVQSRGGGRLVLYHDWTREPFTREKVDTLIKPLLVRQPYLTSVEFLDQPEGIILDVWRKTPSGPPRKMAHTQRVPTDLHWQRRNIGDHVAHAMRHVHPPHDKPWLFCDDPLCVADVIIHRSPRWHNCDEMWRLIQGKYDNKVFVGLPGEHKDFEKEFGYVPYHPTADLWELARVIAGCKVYCGNQSAPMWVALGLCCTKIVQETHQIDDCVFQREGIYYCSGKMRTWDGKWKRDLELELPDA